MFGVGSCGRLRFVFSSRGGKEWVVWNRGGLWGFVEGILGFCGVDDEWIFGFMRFINIV